MKLIKYNFDITMIIIFIAEAIVAQGHNCNATVVGSILTRGNELLFIFSFTPSGTMTKAWRQVSSTLNASKNSSGNGERFDS